MFYTVCLLHCPVYRGPWAPSFIEYVWEKIGHITNINICSYNLYFSEKNVLYFHFIALCYLQCAWKKLKIDSFIEHAYRSRIHITIINIPYYALKLQKCFILPFLICLYCIVLCAERTKNEALNHFHRAPLTKN